MSRDRAALARAFNEVFGPVMQPGASRPEERPPGNLV